MEEIVNEIKKNVETLTGAAVEAACLLKIRILVQRCLNYINRTTLPQELIAPISEHIVKGGVIASVKEGDTQITYNVESVDPLKEQLNLFRVIGTLQEKEDK